MSKRRRTSASSVLGLHGVTDRAVVDILAAVREDPSIVDEVRGRHALQVDADRAFIDAGGVPLQLDLGNGKSFTWHVMQPQSLLRYFVTQCPAFKQLMRAALQAKPPTPEE
eukprot:284311-Alexandrium_andersonii.AAC.1